MSALQKALETSEKLVGTEVGVSNWIEVDQAMIDRFAETTHDTQWIHVDPERAAAETPFGGTIAHGFLTPVKAGSRLRGRFTLQKVQRRNATNMLRTNLLTVEIEGVDTPALVAEWLGIAVFED